MKKIFKIYETIFLYLLLLVVNFFSFIINYINYDSTKGTDYGKYGPYLDYYVFGNDAILQEQGVGYFWFISFFSKLKLNSLLISPEYEFLVLNFGIQVGNFLLYLFGCLGLYYLLTYLGISNKHVLLSLICIAVFPPVIGTRLILKPEILPFSFLPWCILFVFKFIDSDKNKYLYFIVPFLSILASSKASVALMTAIAMLFLFNKKMLNKHLFFIMLLTISSFGVLIYESYLVNGKFVWDHVVPPGYDNVATLSFIYSMNQDIFLDPFRNSQATSMIGILLLDTFGDYWQRYWFNKSGWQNNQFPGNLNTIRIGLLISSIFYIGLIAALIKEKNTRLKKFASFTLIGISVLLVNFFNIFPFLTKNFNPSKGDPFKTHYFSFFLAFSFIYFLIKLFDSDKTFAKIIVISGLLAFSLQLFNSSSIEEIKEDYKLLNKIHLLSPCSIGDPIKLVITYSENWCESEDIYEHFCNGNYDKSLLPKQENGDLIFPKDISYKQRNLIYDKSTVTVGNYFECIHYMEGGFVPQYSIKYFFNNHRQLPYAFNAGMVLILIFVLNFIFMKEDWLKTIKEVRSQEPHQM